MPDPATEVRTLRLATGLTQAELAERLGVAKNTVARWEQGVVIPPTYAMLAVRAVCAPTE
jgi:transcriptional regulator with XRE-family HTH domain